ncbi:MAG TPA: hypothetical protein VHM20_02530, partial [Gammaproteobacteria bacterium]|nr:hypothetical protein [Gammaproteobacteria bacterium]
MPITTFTVLPSGAFVKLNKTHNIEITDCHGKKSYDILNTTQKKVVVVAEFKENFLLVLSYSRQYQYDIYDLKTGVWQNKVTLPNLEGSLLLFNDRLLVTGLEKKFSVFQLHLDHVENITNQYPAHDRFYYNKLLIFDASHSLIFSHSNGLYDHFVIHMFNANNLQWIKDINFKKINRNIVSLRDVNVAGENLYAVMVSLSEYVEIKYRLYSYHLENHTMKKIKKLRLTEESKLLNMDEDLWVVKYKESLYPTLNYHKV